jgi:hypothetical protein
MNSQHLWSLKGGLEGDMKVGLDGWPGRWFGWWAWKGGLENGPQGGLESGLEGFLSVVCKMIWNWKLVWKVA